MIIALILLSTALLAQTVYFLYYKNQIKDIGNQLSFISKHDSFKFVHIQVRPKEIYQLVDICNSLLRGQRELNQQFIKKNEEINTTIISLSHDIRTPLTSLGGYLQMAESTQSLTEKSRYIGLAQTRMKQMVTLVDELFFYTKLQNPEFVLDLDTLDVIDVLQKRLFYFIDEFSRGESEPELELPESPIYILSNSNALERIFENIIKNYFLHGDRDRSLSIRCENESDKVVIHFTNQLKHDQSIQADKIFTRFYKEDLSRSIHSSGLGLFIVKTLMEKMGGSVQVSLKGKKFCLSITFVKAEKEKEYV